MLTVTVPDLDLLARLSDLSDRVELVLWDLLEPLPAEVAQRVEVVQIGHYWVQPERWRRLAEAPNLRYVLLPSAGFEHALPRIPKGVTLCNGRGVHSAGTAELALALILASQRGLVDALDAQRQGRWHNPELPSLADRRVLVVGAGSLAQAIVDRLRPFEVEITQVARTARGGVHGIAELPALLPAADIVVLAVPGSAETHHLLDAAALAALPDGALVVNVARGGVVDTAALLAELEGGRLRAALDVTDPEPLSPDHPLWHAPRTIITAHQGGNSDATYSRVAALLRSQLEHLLAGEQPENVVART
ncbi:MAG: NAD(P)-dependent oxidoreductase [Propionicimonas sp.]|uniref:NAD(P)-dependent oxidoreductase n=1 Tax=Propionicimonas sp. TaxID=1955623 RepID=UPI003D0DAA56